MRKNGPKLLVACVCMLCMAMSLWAQGGKESAQKDENVVQIWTKFNAANPQNAQDEWLANAMKRFEEETGIKVVNTFVPWTELQGKLNLAVQAGGTVPDLALVENDINFFFNNGVLMDITDHVRKSSWGAGLTRAGLEAGTARDGKIYGVPSMISGSVVYYWTAAYPDGPPRTTEDVLKAGARLAKDGKFAITFKGAETVGAQLFYFQLVETFGSTYTDNEGSLIFASEGTVKAVDFLRTLFADRYAPEVCLSAGFDFETPFKDGNAGAFVAGSWSYVFLNPLTSPDGRVFDHGALSVEEAIRAGALGITDPIAAPGSRPYTSSNAMWTGFGIPVRARNVDGAKQFLDWLMQVENNADFAFSFGSLPSMEQAMQDPKFVESKYWNAVYESIKRTGKSVVHSVNPRFTQKFDEIMITLIHNPNLDALTELRRVQNELNTER